jgi:hypothetical protein
MGIKRLEEEMPTRESVQCPYCGKRVKQIGLSQHCFAKHPDTQLAKEYTSGAMIECWYCKERVPTIDFKSNLLQNHSEAIKTDAERVKKFLAQKETVNLEELSKQGWLSKTPNGRNGSTLNLSKQDFGYILAWMRDHQRYPLRRVKMDHWVKIPPEEAKKKGIKKKEPEKKTEEKPMIEGKLVVQGIIDKLEHANIPYIFKEDRVIARVMAGEYTIYSDGRIEGEGIGKSVLKRVFED